MKALVAHGGAGPSKKVVELRDEISSIANKGYEEEDAVDAVEKVITLLEKHPAFNAGMGSKLQLDGKPRPEAGIMKDDLDMGSVIGLDGISNPISVARLIMEESDNNIISSPFSTQFALSHGFEKKDLVVDERLESWLEMRDEIENRDYLERIREMKNIDGGTVGCVAIDDYGNMCAGTSTGGRNNQIEGRVGDSPLVGCGFYCDENVAVSTTGVGEDIMSSQLAMRVSTNYDSDLKEALRKSINYLSNHTEGFAGIAAVSKNSEAAIEYNAEDMIYEIIK